MKPVYQTIMDDVLGDCFRACVASIFEFPIERMPNFWEQTQDGPEFWRLNDEWANKYLGYRCVSMRVAKSDMDIVEDVLCIACAKSPRGEVDHAVVWKNGVVHDPHPSNAGLAEEPDTFTVFIPLDPARQRNGLCAVFVACS